tara:strand:+ start:218 stop:553 length:336 start_codon:yes stop_codon:yes gene_type:complete
MVSINKVLNDANLLNDIFLQKHKENNKAVHTNYGVVLEEFERLTDQDNAWGNFRCERMPPCGSDGVYICCDAYRNPHQHERHRRHAPAGTPPVRRVGLEGVLWRIQDGDFD